MKAIIFSTVLLIISPMPMTATEYQIELDPDNTTIVFALGATLHTVHGSISAISGTQSLDASTGQMRGTVTIDATSAETGNKKRDKKMHTRVLLSSKHPQIVLQPSRFEGELRDEGVSEIAIHGHVEILGRAHEIILPLTVETSDGQFTATGEFDVPYVEWGLDDPSTFVLRVAKKVTITVSSAGSIQRASY